jgi:hypothetical protein
MSIQSNAYGLLLWCDAQLLCTPSLNRYKMQADEIVLLMKMRAANDRLAVYDRREGVWQVGQERKGLDEARATADGSNDRSTGRYLLVIVKAL